MSAHPSNPVAALRLFAFGTAGAYVAGRSVADGVLLGELGADLLPLLYVTSAVLSTVLSVAFAFALRRLPVWRVSRSLMLAGSTLTILSAVALQLAPHRMSAVLLVFILAEVRGVIGTVLMATLVNEAFSVDDAKRSVGKIHGFSTLAGIVIGALVGLEASWWENYRILYAAGALELFAAATIGRIKRSIREREAGDEDATADFPTATLEIRWHRESWLIVAAASLIVMRTSVGLLVEFQWKTSAAGIIADAEDLTAYFGAFYSAMYLLTGLMQWLATERVLRRRGIGVALALFPIGLLAASGYGLVARGNMAMLRAMSLTKACDVFKRAFHDPAMQLLSAPLSAQRRRRSVTLLNGALKPLTEITIGLLLLDIETAVTSRHLTVFTVTLILIWLGVTRFAKRNFDNCEAIRASDRTIPKVGMIAER